MPRDWDFHRAAFFAEAKAIAYEKVKEVNNTIKSKMERIVGLELTKLYVPFSPSELKIKSQAIIAQYDADFLITYKQPLTNKEFLIVVECDDKTHNTLEQLLKDRDRNYDMAAEGYMILRYSGSSILANPNQIVKDVTALIYKYRGWD